MSTELRAKPGRKLTARDVVAGVSVALVAIPQSMAYAELAGMPSHHGLYAVSLPLVAAAFFASSPYLQTGPVATTALLTFGALVPIASPGSAEFVVLAALLALLVGLIRIAVGVMRLGWLSYLMSRPVLEGFMMGAAVLIVASQLPGALGVVTPEGGVLRRAAWALAHPDSWDATSLAMAAGTVVVIVGGRRIHPLLPGVLIAAAAGLVLSVVLDYQGTVVGQIPKGLPPFSIDLPWQMLPALLLPALVIALVGFAEAASISRAFATEDRMRWEADREFVSQGVANLVSGLVSGFPVGGSFARSSLGRTAGARTRWAGLVTGLCVLAMLPFTGVLAPLPIAVLAGIVVAAVWKFLRPRKLLDLWPVSRTQALVGWSTFVLTLALAPRIEQAVLLGILIAGAVHLWRELRPEMNVRRDGNTLHLSPSGVLWFGSAPVLDDVILGHLERETDVDEVVLHCQGLGRIDLTGAATLAEMLEQLRSAGIRVRVLGVPEHARRILDAVGEPGEPLPAPGEERRPG